MNEPILLPLRSVKYDFEPLSSEALASFEEPEAQVSEQDIESPWALCDGYQVLKKELRRYCEGRFRGQSFLVAGHRGSGKTLLTHLAIQVNRFFFANAGKSPSADSAARAPKALPFLVPIHGPDLMAGWNQPSNPTSNEFARHAMEQILLSLQKAFKDEILHHFKQSFPEPHYAPLIAELDRDLLSSQSASSLTRTWQRLNLLDRGILGKRYARAGNANGRSEILLLESLNHASERLRSHSSNEITVGTGADTKWRFNLKAVKEYWLLITPILSVAVAIFAATQVKATAPKELSWLIPGVVFLLMFVISRRLLGPGIFGTPDGGLLERNSLPDLDRALPSFVARMHQCGFAPIFVVDELGKVADTEQCMTAFMRQLKYFATDEAFFCFLTDRKYLEVFQATLDKHVYPEEQTYFGHRILVHYTLKEVSTYIRGRFEENQKDPAELHLARLLLLFESHCQPDEADRCLINSYESRSHAFEIEHPGIRASAAYRLHAFIILCMDEMLRSPMARQRIRQNKQFAAWCLDSLYMIIQQWKDHDGVSTLQLDRKFLLHGLAQKLNLGREGQYRMGDILSEEEIRFLLTLMNKFIKRLDSPSILFKDRLSDLLQPNQDSTSSIFNLWLCGMQFALLKSSHSETPIELAWNFTYWGSATSHASRDWANDIATFNSDRILHSQFRNAASIIKILQALDPYYPLNSLIRERVYWLLEHLFGVQEGPRIFVALLSSPSVGSILDQAGIEIAEWEIVLFSNLFHYCSLQNNRASLLLFLLRKDKATYEQIEKDRVKARLTTRLFLRIKLTNAAGHEKEIEGFLKTLHSGGAFGEVIQALNHIWTMRNNN